MIEHDQIIPFIIAGCVTAGLLAIISLVAVALNHRRKARNRKRVHELEQNNRQVNRAFSEVLDNSATTTTFESTNSNVNETRNSIDSSRRNGATLQQLNTNLQRSMDAQNRGGSRPPSYRSALRSRPSVWVPPTALANVPPLDEQPPPSYEQATTELIVASNEPER